MAAIHWSCREFRELTLHELYSLLQLRTEVFIIEQNCVYQDMDDNDQVAMHVIGARDGELLCYARILPPSIKYKTPSIGRVITHQTLRQNGYGKQLMGKALDYCRQYWPTEPITISAQQRLQKFYSELGFVTESAPYLEDGIPHIQMRYESLPS